MYACTHVRMYACTHVRMYACTHVRMRACMYAGMSAGMYAGMYACTHVEHTHRRLLLCILLVDGSYIISYVYYPIVYYIVDCSYTTCTLLATHTISMGRRGGRGDHLTPRSARVRRQADDLLWIFIKGGCSRRGLQWMGGSII